ncbi:hypothetical protein V5738_15430 [Salinisphaera sp. SPP-AMP-43]|uniref:hypothetical protein n=1 Tax=Salinisphaera sp. SPP-AMP-43 TaxID=3121288 RepID=UPI003C6E22E5
MSSTPSRPPIRRSTERALWWGCVVLLSIFLTTIQLAATKPYPLTDFDRVVYMQAVEPFQHRVLVPAAVRFIEHYIPIGHRLTFGLIEVTVWIILFALAERALRLFGVGQGEAKRRLLALSLAVPMAIVTLMPDLRVAPAFIIDRGRLELGEWHLQYLFYYPYDLPAAVFTLLLVLLIIAWSQRLTGPRLALICSIFTIATVNRETTMFLIPMAGLLLLPHQPWTTILKVLALLTILFVAVQLPLHWIFAANVNPHASLVGDLPYEQHWAQNLAQMSQPFYLLAQFVRLAGGCLLPVLLWWPYVDPRLKRALIGFVLPLGVIALFAGRLVEHRIFVEIAPLLWLAALCAIRGRVHQSTAVRVTAAADRQPSGAAISQAYSVHADPPESGDRNP